MSGRYDVLTEKDFAAHEVRWEVRQEVRKLLEGCGGRCDRKCVKVLDWGCGRGESVGKFLDQGLITFGVDIDREVIEKGHLLFKERGYDPQSIIMHVNELDRFPDGFFDMIFSEEVFEHIENIGEVTREMSRLTKPGGIGVHLFPGAKRVIEPHLFMPFVHWLPKHRIRQLVIAAFLILKIGPRWPHAEKLGLWGASDVYRSYLDEYTHYRDRDSILESFWTAGFETKWETCSSLANQFAPKFLRENGFGGDIALFTQRLCA